MATSLGELWLRIGLRGSAEVVSGLQSVGSAAQSASAQTTSLQNSTTRLSSGFQSAMGEAFAFAASLTTMTKALMAFSGIDLATRYQGIEEGLKNMLGSSEKATKLMESLKKMGADTKYETVDLIGFARRLLTTGSTASSVTGELQTLANTASNLGLPVGEVGEMVEILSRLGLQAHAGADTFAALAARGVKMTDVAKFGAGREFTGKFAEMQAAQFLAGMNGSQARDLIFRALKKMYPEGVVDFSGLVNNTFESVRNIMLSTGTLLIGALTPALVLVKNIAEIVGKFNKITQGLAGFAVVLPAVAVAGYYAFTRLMALDAAIMALGASAQGATGKVAANAAANTLGGIGNMGALGSLLPKLARGGVAAMGIGLAGEGLKRVSPKSMGGFWENMAGGAGMGAMAGSIIPGLGTAAGAIIGAIGGGIKGLYEGYQSKGGDTQKALLDESKKQTGILSDMNGKMYGGDRRTGRFQSDLEAEIGLQRALALKGV
jgi:hypothetical protein